MPFPIDIQNINLGEPSSHTLIMDIQEALKFGKHGIVAVPYPSLASGTVAYNWDGAGTTPYAAAEFSAQKQVWEMDTNEAVAFSLALRPFSVLHAVSAYMAKVDANHIARVEVYRARNALVSPIPAFVAAQATGTGALWISVAAAPGGELISAANDAIVVVARNATVAGGVATKINISALRFAVSQTQSDQIESLY